MERIHGNKAFAMFKAKQSFVICPSNINPESDMALTFQRTEDYADMRKAYRIMLNRFSYYNCSKETGNTIHFYAE